MKIIESVTREMLSSSSASSTLALDSGIDGAMEASPFSELCDDEVCVFKFSMVRRRVWISFSKDYQEPGTLLVILLVLSSRLTTYANLLVVLLVLPFILLANLLMILSEAT